MSVLSESAFAELVEPYRRELHLHCYRIVGSLTEADDVVQETLLAAWRGLPGFEGRASLRTWLYRIATNRGLNALRRLARRPREAELPEPTRLAEPLWLHPYPDAMLDAVTAPDSRYEEREAVGLAFTTLLQRLPARQRAAVVLVDVLGFRAGEAAAMLEATPIAVKGMLRRARATLDAHRESVPEAGDAREREVAALFARAMEDGDTPAIVSLLTDDAWLTMPPMPHEYQGPAAIAAFLESRARVRPGPLTTAYTRANGQPALVAHVHAPEGVRPYGVLVLAVSPAGLERVTGFIGPAVFGHFGF
ncbi:RNA polymerase sigma factor [Actinorhabdospora filicis]|uniref:RNA polymerase sigma factor n=1 Tax=Actinorhabdospora filicis TaxID=1785913 RepID=A0A9W6STY7_9ACTN|nr:RNA polymerase subunit sigma-70 [Actinorhabdospora filicis]GLZ81909.1 RNA polymerase sigma factor [Actinorhabdospora filicis]